MIIWGGEQAVLDKAKQSFDNGEYRWVAEVMKHAVFANPNNIQSTRLLADAFEQLGYQAESGPWRSIYLQGANELRHGVKEVIATGTATPDTIRAMTPEMLFDFFAVRLNSNKAAGKILTMNINFTDINSKHTLTVENSVLNYTKKQINNADVSVVMTMSTLNKIQFGQLNFDTAVANGKIKITGNKAFIDDFLQMIDTPPFWFNIVTP